LARVERLAVGMKLWPLLHGELSVDAVQMEGVTLQLIRNRDGEGNWEGLAPPPPQAQADIEEGGGQTPVVALAIGSLRLRNGQITLDDRLLGRRLSLDAIELESGPLRPGEPMELRLAFAPRLPALTGQVRLQGAATFDPVSGWLEVAGLSARLDAEGALLDGGSGRLELTGGLRAMLGRGLGALSAELRGLRLHAEIDRAGLRGKAELAGDLHFDHLDRRLRGDALRLQVRGQANGNELRGELQGGIDASFDGDGLRVARLGEFALAGEMRQEGVAVKGVLRGDLELDRLANRVVSGPLRLAFDAEGATLPGGPLHGEARAQLSATLDGAAFHLAKLQATAEDLLLEGDLNGYNLATNPTLDGQLRLPTFDLRRLLSRRGLSLPASGDPSVLQRVKASLGFKAERGTGLNSGSLLRLSPLELEVDDSRLTGNVTLKGGTVGFELTLDRIDLDRYLPPQPPPTPPATEDAAPSPLDWLRKLDVNGALEVGQAQGRGLRAEKLRLRLRGANGLWTLDPQVGAFYQGDLQGELGIDLNGAPPQLRLKGSATGLALAPLLRDLGGEERLSGKAHLDADLKAKGLDAAAVRHSLGGTLGVRIEDGSIAGFNLAQLLLDRKASLLGEALEQEALPPRTDFSELTASVSFAEGILSNRDLTAKAPLLRLEGAGTLELPRGPLDYHLTALVVNSAKGPGVKGLKALEGLPIAIRLRGDYLGPDYQIELEPLLGEISQRQSRAKAEPALPKAPPETAPPVQEAMQGPPP